MLLPRSTSSWKSVQSRELVTRSPTVSTSSQNEEDDLTRRGCFQLCQTNDDIHSLLHSCCSNQTSANNSAVNPSVDNFFLDPELFVSDPDQAKMKQLINNSEFIFNSVHRDQPKFSFVRHSF